MIKFGIQLPHELLELIMKAAAFADRSNIDSVFTPNNLVGVGMRNFPCYETFTILGKLSYFNEKSLSRHPCERCSEEASSHAPLV